MARRQKRKRSIPKLMTKKARGRATSQLMRMNGKFKKIASAVPRMTAMEGPTLPPVTSDDYF